MHSEIDYGVAAWSSASWRESAVSWLDEQLAAAGIERTGDVEQPHLRPWSTVLTAPTTAGSVWLKAAGRANAFEAALYELRVPEHVLTPIVADTARGWILLPDGGSTLGDRKAGTDVVEPLVAALVQYGRLQRELAPHVDELLALGIADMRPAAMPERFDQALEAVGFLRARDAYLEVFSDLAPADELSDTLGLACPRGQDRPRPDLGSGVAGGPGAGRGAGRRLGDRTVGDPRHAARRVLPRRSLIA